MRDLRADWRRWSRLEPIISITIAAGATASAALPYIVAA